MNILVIGAGSVGIGLAASVASQGADVSIYARGKTAKAIKENGVTKVETSTGYRFNEEGLYISKAGEAMENKLDNTGMYVSRSGKVILQANNQGVEAHDVTVRNFLIIGDFARLENHESGTDTRRTACFWIGG